MDTITLEIVRSDPSQRSRFDVPVPTAGSRVLDALIHVREHLDPTLGFRYACRAGMCGSCAVVVNGREALSCQLPVKALGTRNVHVAPLRALPVLRDLVCDMTPFFDGWKRAHAALHSNDPARTTPRTMPPGEPRRALIEGQSGCLTCGACDSACADMLGGDHAQAPAALNRVLMLALDERDRQGATRVEPLAQETARLHAYAHAPIDEVCPVGIPLRRGMDALERLVAGELPSPLTRV
jgi:succinate dehydrogenase/fumarate reductase iron-sulfur protein